MGDLERTGNDLKSLLGSTDIAVIFPDIQFRIRRYTPAVMKLVDLIPTDVGRPLANLAMKFADPSLIDDAGRPAVDHDIAADPHASAAVKAATGGVIDFRCGEHNAAFARFSGLTDPTGHTVRESIPALDREWIARYADVLRTGTAQRFEGHSAGSDRRLDVYAFRVGGPGSVKIGLLFRDITGPKNARAD